MGIFLWEWTFLIVNYCIIVWAKLTVYDYQNELLFIIIILYFSFECHTQLPFDEWIHWFDFLQRIRVLCVAIETRKILSGKDNVDKEILPWDNRVTEQEDIKPSSSETEARKYKK